MRQRTLAGHGVLARLGGLLVLVLALGVLLTGCGGSEDEANTNVPTSPEDAGQVMVRVSGTEGIAYSGIYGNISGELQTIDDTLGTEPTDYEIEVQEGVSDGVTAALQKTESGQGELKVQILADDQVVVESRTLAELGEVNADWFPQVGPPGFPQIAPPEETTPVDEQVDSEG